MEERTMIEHLVSLSPRAMTTMLLSMNMVIISDITWQCYILHINSLFDLIDNFSNEFCAWGGLLREPKYSHLKELHKVIKLCEPALVSVDPTIISLGNKQEVSMQRYLEEKKHHSYNFFFCYNFRLMCLSPRLLALRFFRITTQILQQELCSGDFPTICPLGLSVFYLTAKPSITTLQRLINL